MYVSTHTFTYTYVCVITISEKRGHECEGEWEACMRGFGMKKGEGEML